MRNPKLGNIDLKRKLEPVLDLAPDVAGTLADDPAEIRVGETHDRVIPVDLVERVVGFDTHFEFEALVQPKCFAQGHIGLRRTWSDETFVIVWIRAEIGRASCRERV